MPADESKSLDEQKSTGFVPGDALGNRFRLTLGWMTDEGRKQWKEARDDRKEAADCAKCEKNRDYLLMYSESASAFRRVCVWLMAIFQAPSFGSCGRTSTSWEQTCIARISAAADVSCRRKEALILTTVSYCAPTTYGAKAMSKTPWLMVSIEELVDGENFGS